MSSSPNNFDVVILGGGITGAAAARDAARRGLSVLLLEKGDFASGTSSKSSKLIHGGQRYLESFDFRLVRDSCLERNALSQIAPHLVRPLPFLFPVVRGRSPSRAALAAGLALYRLLGTGARPGRQEFLSRGDEALLREAPDLAPGGWTGAYRYFDAQADDCLLTLAFLRDARAAGAELRSYTEAARITRGAKGEATGVEARDVLRDRPFSAAARVVVCALGPWSNALSALLGESLAPSVRPSRGAHFFLPPGRLPLAAAVVLLDRGGRRCYAIPWRGGALLGTTDELDPTPPDGVAPTARDREIVLGAVNAAFPSRAIGPSDIAGGFAGLRPLAAFDGKPAAGASRDESIFSPVPRVIASVGGKLTTARRTAIRLIDRVEGVLRKDFGRRPAGPARRLAPLPGGDIEDFARLRERIRKRAFEAARLSPEHADRILEREGSAAESAIARIASNRDLARPISGSMPYTVADLVWGAEQAFAARPDDLLARRTRLSWESPGEAEALRGLCEEVLAGRFRGGLP
jgi:glycerol-3-phosphate dehydrogenase